MIRQIVKRADGPVLADAPSKVDVNNDQVKKYAQEGVDKLNESGKNVELDKIIEATFYPPAGKLMYDIKMKMKDGQECITHVWKESGPDTSVTVDCGNNRKRRDTEPVIMDKPMNQQVDDPQVKKYAQEGIEKLIQSGDKVRLDKIVEATFFPPAGKLMYEIKMNVQNEESNDMKMCTVHVEKGSPDVSVHVECDKSRRRRAKDEPEDMPMKRKVDDPQVKKYAEEGVEKLKMSGDKVRLNEIVEATFFPPAGKLMYEIKMKVENDDKKDDMKVCTVHVERGSGPDVEIHVECDSKKEKRATGESPQMGDDYIADKPIGLDVTKPDIINYAKEGLKEYAKKYPDSKVEVVEIVEA